MSIRRFMVTLGMATSMFASALGGAAPIQLTHAAPARGPMARFCRVSFPVVAGVSRITGQLITDNSFRCERRILGSTGGGQIPVTVLATYYNDTSTTPPRSEAYCSVTYWLPAGLGWAKFETVQVDRYHCTASAVAGGVTFIASAG